MEKIYAKFPVGAVLSQGTTNESAVIILKDKAIRSSDGCIIKSYNEDGINVTKVYEVYNLKKMNVAKQLKLYFKKFFQLLRAKLFGSLVLAFDLYIDNI